MKRLLAVTTVLLLAACGPKPLDNAGAAKIITAHPSFADPIERLPLAPDIVENSIGVDAGVIEGVWKLGARGSHGQPTRELTAKGKEFFKDASGVLATPGRREVAELTSLVEDPNDRKHRSAEFTWRYQIPPMVARYTGLDGTYKGKAELRYDREWKVESIQADAKPSSFRWTAELGAQLREMLSAEQEATTQRVLAVEPQRFTTPDKRPYTITIADVQVTMDDETSRYTVPYLELTNCRVDAQPASVTLRVEGIRQDIVAVAGPAALSAFQKVCDVVKEAHDNWAAHNREIADRGPLGVAYSR